MMLTAPIPATERVLERAGLTLDDMDLVEINEAFATVVLAWEQRAAPGHGQGQRQRRGDRARSPARLLRRAADDDVLHELERTGGRYGLQTMCEGGGMANATIIERSRLLVFALPCFAASAALWRSAG